jgi:uncharacterized OB-fold protein
MSDGTEVVSDEELVSLYPDQPVDQDTRERYRGWLRHEHVVDRCVDCGAFREPPGPICPRCWSTDVERVAVRGTGTIHLAIFLHQGPRVDGVDYSSPHPVVVVELDEQPGLRVTGTVVAASNDDIHIGSPVEMTWIERLGSPRPAFRLVGAS